MAANHYVITPKKRAAKAEDIKRLIVADETLTLLDSFGEIFLVEASAGRIEAFSRSNPQLAVAPHREISLPNPPSFPIKPPLQG